MDISTFFLIVLGVAVLFVLAFLYVSLKEKNSSRKIAYFYDSWVEPFGLEPLSTDKKAAKRNSQILFRTLKIIRQSGVVTEINLRHDIPDLTQDYALEYLHQAEELFLTKRTLVSKGFIYDVSDAKEGNLSLLLFDKNSQEYKSFALSQIIIQDLVTIPGVDQFPQIVFDENVSEIGDVKSFILSCQGIERNRTLVGEVVRILKEKYINQQWVGSFVTQGSVKFYQAENTVKETSEKNVGDELSPFDRIKSDREKINQQKFYQSQK